MPDESKAAEEHALMAQITEPLAALPGDPASLGAQEFPVVLRGYDRIAVDAYVASVSEELTVLRAAHSPDLAVRRALERVGEQISGILQRAHETAAQITSTSRREAEERLQSAHTDADERVRSAHTDADERLRSARAEADELLQNAHTEAEERMRTARADAEALLVRARERLRDLDADTDRIWSERGRIVDDVRRLAGELSELADVAAERFPAASEEGAESPVAEGDAAGGAPAEESTVVLDRAELQTAVANDPPRPVAAPEVPPPAASDAPPSEAPPDGD